MAHKHDFNKGVEIQPYDFSEPQRIFTLWEQEKCWRHFLLHDIEEKKRMIEGKIHEAKLEIIANDNSNTKKTNDNINVSREEIIAKIDSQKNAMLSSIQAWVNSLSDKLNQIDGKIKN